MKPRWTLLTRSGCGLCEEFEHAFRTAAGSDRIDLNVADVDSREDWKRRFGLKIPVLLSEQGEMLCAVHFDPACLP